MAETTEVIDLAQNPVVEKLLSIDKRRVDRLPYSELLVRLQGVESARSIDSILRRVQENLLEDEFIARLTIQFCESLRADGHLPEPITALPGIEPSLNRWADW